MTKISSRLDTIEKLLSVNKRILNVDEAAVYLNMAKSYLYKLTSNGTIPYSKPGGKKLFFDRLLLDKYLLGNPSKTNAELETEASTFVTTGV